MARVKVLGTIAGDGRELLVTCDFAGGFTVTRQSVLPAFHASAVPIIGEVVGPGNFISIDMDAAGGYTLRKSGTSPGTLVKVVGRIMGDGDYIKVSDEGGSLAFSVGFYAIGTVSPEASQFLARIPINDPDRAAYRAMIDYLVSQNRWQMIEALYIRACANKATSLVNVKSASHLGIQVGLADGQFTPYGGWTGDGNPAHYVDNNLNPFVSPGILGQDDCAYGEYITAGTISGVQSGGGNANLYFQFYNDGQFYYRPQSAGDIAVGPNPANPLGLWIVTRTAPNAGAVYRDSVLYASDSGGDVAFKNQSLLTLGLAGVDSSTLTTKATLITRGMTAGDAAVFRTAINTFFP